MIWKVHLLGLLEAWRKYYMLPLDAFRGSLRQKTLELEPANKEDGEGIRTVSPLLRPESTGNAHPGSEQGRKGTVLTELGSSPSPRG